MMDHLVRPTDWRALAAAMALGALGGYVHQATAETESIERLARQAIAVAQQHAECGSASCPEALIDLAKNAFRASVERAAARGPADPDSVCGGLAEPDQILCRKAFSLTQPASSGPS